jgi:predicted component of type VI protein secretion system
MGGAGADWAELALRSARADFARMHEHPFLVGSSTLKKPARPQLTNAFVMAFDPVTLDGQQPDPMAHDEKLPLMLAVRKAQTNFPSMITVGRTENNDICLPDVTVSRFHAFFRKTGARLEIGDAGSRNGSWLAGRRLPPKGPMQAVTFGDVVRFGNLSFSVLDAGAAWDELHTLD